MADALAWIMLGISLIGLPFAACIVSQRADDPSDQSLDLIDGDIRPADLLNSVRNADALSPFHADNQ